MKKGQSLIDIVFLILAVMVVFFAFAKLNLSASYNAQAARYTSQEANAELFSVLEDQIFMTDGLNNVSGRVVDLIDFWECNSCYVCTQKLPAEINSTLKKFNTNKHFIFDVPGLFRVYDNYSSVYLHDVSVASFNFTTNCGKISNITYGSWFAWQNPRGT